MEMTRELVMRYLRGELDDASAQQVSQWLDEHPDAPGHWLDEQVWNELVTETQVAHGQKTGRIRTLTWRIAGVAAALLLFFTAKQLLVSKRPSTAHATASASYVKKLSNDSRHVLAYTLPDGSIAELQPQATLSFDTVGYNTSERRLLLQGIARFTVAKDKTRPFRVVSGKWTTTALGTIFHVSFTTSDTFLVKLEEGRIKVEANASTSHAAAYFLTPGDVFTDITGSNGQAMVTKASLPDKKPVRSKPGQPIATERDSWTFEHTPVQELIHHLENAYGVTIDLDVKDKQKDFTGTLHKDDPLDLQLTLLCNLNGWHWDKTDSTILIRQ